MKKKNYLKIEDFLSDDSFKNWAKKTQLTDVEFWENWILNNPDKEELALAAKELIIGIQFNQKDVDFSIIDQEWNRLENCIQQVNKPKVISNPFYKHKKWMTVAASVFLLISISVIYFTNKNTRIVHKTTYGEVSDIRLPDGSLVTLNANSSVSYNKNDPRNIFLQGEAYFEVEKKLAINAKFWVETDDLKVEVYGTAFNVNNRKERTQVYLEEGNIELKLKNGKEKHMTPGDLISYSHKLNSVLEEKSIRNASLQTSWKEGSLTFERTPLINAFEKIEVTYGIAPIFEDQRCKNILITGAVPTHDLEICIKTIEKSAQVTIVNENNKLYIRKK